MSSVVISLDAELAWGYHDLHPLTSEQMRRVSGARGAWTELVELFDEYAIPATWAVVGHLLTRDHDAVRQQHPGPDDWFQTYLARRNAEPTQWFGGDLVRALQNADVDHEIGSHTFSHVVFDEASIAVAEAELRLSREFAGEYGLDPTSFVFPRNRVGHRSLLKSYGFTCYRGPQPRRHPNLRGAGYATMLSGYLSGTPTPPIVTPEVDEYGLVNVPASMFLGGFNVPPWRVVEPVRGDPGTRLARLGIDHLTEREGVFHIWFHPNDVLDDRTLDRVRDVLSHVASRRDRGEIEVETMGDVARRTRTQVAGATR